VGGAAANDETTTLWTLPPPPLPLIFLAAAAASATRNNAADVARAKDGHHRLEIARVATEVPFVAEVAVAALPSSLAPLYNCLSVGDRRRRT